MRFIRTIFAAMLAVAAVTATAAADRLSVNSTSFFAVWDDDVGAQQLQLSAGEMTVECDVTMRGSFHSGTFAKTIDSLIGSITGVEIQSCSEGRALALTTTLPWHVTYKSFSGTLPRIDLVRLAVVGMQLRMEVNASADCLVVADRSDPVEGNILLDTETGVVDALDALQERTVSLDDIPGGSSFLCDEVGQGSLNGLADLADDEDGVGDIVARLAEDSAVLTATPSSVTIARLARDGIFTIRNTDDDATATITRVAIESADREAPEFGATAPGCSTRIAPGESCTYTVAVNSRPEREGRAIVHYRDGTRTEAERTTTVEVDIEG